MRKHSGIVRQSIVKQTTTFFSKKNAQSEKLTKVECHGLSSEVERFFALCDISSMWVRMVD